MRLQLDTSITGSGGLAGAAAGTPPGGAQGTIARLSAADAASAADSGSGDTAYISGPSSLLSRLSSDRSARIQQLTASVSAGSYRISAASIGRALVAEALA